MLKLKHFILASLACVLAIIFSSCSAPSPTYEIASLTYEGSIPKLDYVAASADQGESLLQKNPNLAKDLVLSAFVKGVIYYAEGTYGKYAPAGAPSPYDVITGGSTLDANINALPNPSNKYADHPRLLWNLWQERPAQAGDPCGDGTGGSDLCSDAAGAGQFLSTTWDGIVEQYGHEFYPGDKFSPINQEFAVLILLAKRGSYNELMAGTSVDGNGKVVVNVENFTKAVHLACGEWASFPCEDGRSNFPAQHARPIEELWQNFQQVLNEKQGAIVPLPKGAPPEQKLTVPINPANPEENFPDVLKGVAADGDVIQGAGETFPVTDIRRIRTVDPSTGTPTNRWHKGFDIATPTGTKLIAPMAGTNECGDDGGRGGMYSVFTPDDNPSRQFVSCHLSKCAGGHFAPGAADVPVFAETGDTGIGTGPHWHFEMWVYSGSQWDHVDYAKGWMEAFLTGKLPSK